MAVKDLFKVSRKTFFNPSGWLGINELSAYTRVIGTNLKSLFTPAKPQRTETFEQALKRLNVTETDLQYNASHYRLYAVGFAALSIAAILVGFYYLFSYGTFAGWTLAMMMAILFAANAFRFDFWYFQIKHRTLGCTFDDWWRGGKPGAKKGPTA